MKIKNVIRSLVLRFGFHISKRSSLGKTDLFVNRISASIRGVKLTRIGGIGDGGYLVPDDLDGISACFSPGVSTLSDFEEELAENYRIRSYMADGSVDCPPSKNNMFDFEKTYLGSHENQTHMTLGSWMGRKISSEHTDDFILQMDIEGSEYDVLIETSPNILRKFRIIIIEFHGLDGVFSQIMSSTLQAVFDKLLKDFVIVHMHPNNGAGIVKFDNLEVPRIVEFTFLRKDRLKHIQHTEEIQLPHILDEPNVSTTEEINMPEVWWRSK